MIRIALVGSIGSGKSHIAELFKFPVFNADLEVNKIYSKDKKRSHLHGIGHGRNQCLRDHNRRYR